MGKPMSTFRDPDPKPTKRVRNPKVLKGLHSKRVFCVLCGKPGSLHHIYPRGQGGDDVEDDLIGLFGDGVGGHHGLIESGNVAVRLELKTFIMAERDRKSVV